MRLFAAFAVALALSGSASAGTIFTQWNFNSDPPDSSTGTGTTNPSIGMGTVSTVGGVTNPGFNSGNGSSDPAATDDSGYQTTTYPAQGTGDKTAGVQFSVSTVGWQDIVVTWDQRHSNTASRWVQFQYTLDGTTFVDFGSLFEGNAGDTWFNGRSIDLTSIAGANNNASFAIRIVSTFAPGTTTYVASNPNSTYATTGTWRFDMVTFSGNVYTPGGGGGGVIPEPSSVIALSIGLVGLSGLALRRRRS